MLLQTKQLLEEFKDRLDKATRVDIASAWLTLGPALDLLCEVAEIRKVRVRAIVGTYGNATHPDALERLNKIGSLRLVDGTQALFHPKIYIFRDGGKASAWIGSANFTAAGFTRNEEVVYQTKHVKGAVDWFKWRWGKCNPLYPDAIDEYRRRRQREGIKRSLVEVVGRDEKGSADRLGYLEGADSWQSYMKALKLCEESFLNEGCCWSVLGASCSYVHTIEVGREVARRKGWVGLTAEDRSRLLGLRDGDDGFWKLLGSLSGAGRVRGVFYRPNEGDNRQTLGRVKRALDSVISASDEHFPDVAVDALGQISQAKGFSCGAATRLLTLGRPDRLVSVNMASRNGLATAFGLTSTKLGNPDCYGDLLELIYKRPWYGSRPGRKKLELKVWSMRAALIDSFVYDPGS